MLLPLLALAAVPAILVFLPGVLLALALLLPALLPVLMVVAGLLAPASTQPASSSAMRVEVPLVHA